MIGMQLKDFKRGHKSDKNFENMGHIFWDTQYGCLLTDHRKFAISIVSVVYLYIDTHLSIYRYTTLTVNIALFLWSAGRQQYGQ